MRLMYQTLICYQVAGKSKKISDKEGSHIVDVTSQVKPEVAIEQCYNFRRIGKL